VWRADVDGAEGPAWLPVRAEHTIATAAAVGPRGWACHARRCRFAVGAVAVWNDRPADRRFDAVLTASGDLAPSQKVELILVTADDLGELPESSGADGLRTGHDLAAERDDLVTGATEYNRREITAALSRCTTTTRSPPWLAPDFVSQIGVSISQHLTGSPTVPGGSDHDRTAARQLPCRPARQAFLSPSQKYEIWLQLVRGEVTIAEAASAQQVDRSTILRSRTVAKEGALAALAASKAGVQGRERDYELKFLRRRYPVCA